jgi:hypothetical protein
MRKARKYVYIFTDRYGNELQILQGEAYNILEARKIAKIYAANSIMNDLYKIKVKRYK